MSSNAAGRRGSGGHGGRRFSFRATEPQRNGVVAGEEVSVHKLLTRARLEDTEDVHKPEHQINAFVVFSHL